MQNFYLKIDYEEYCKTASEAHKWIE